MLIFIDWYSIALSWYGSAILVLEVRLWIDKGAKQIVDARISHKRANLCPYRLLIVENSGV